MHRRVFLIGNYAIKVAWWYYKSHPEWFLKGLINNIEERKRTLYWAKEGFDIFKNITCPTIYRSSFGVFSIQKRVKICTDPQFLLIPEKTIESMKLLTSDIKSDNVGIYKGKYVLVDYGD